MVEQVRGERTEGIATDLRGAAEARGATRPALSVVIPAYNEAARLPSTLRAVLDFLVRRGEPWEVIVADDGSDDGTAAVVEALAGGCAVRCLRLPHRGKAAAVRAGVAAAQGEIVVFTDADLSTPIEYVDDAARLLRGGWDVVIGSREGEGARRIGEPVHRHLMGRVFNYAVQALLVPGISDTQCGFKAFRAAAARDIFAHAYLYSNGVGPIRGPLVTGFDVELLFLARKRGYRVYELPVTWRHVEGSKVRPGHDAVRMLRDVLQVRLNDLRGRYERAEDGGPRAGG